MPRRHRVDQQRAIGLLQIALDQIATPNAAMQRVVAWKVEITEMTALDHRCAEHFGQRHEVLDGAGGTPDLVGDDQRTGRTGQHLRRALDRRCTNDRLRRDAIGRPWLDNHRLEHVLHRDRDERRTTRGRHRQLAGTLNRRGQDCRIGEGVAPLHDVAHQLGRPAVVGKHSQPLLARIGGVHVAEADRLAGEHHHRHALV